MLMVKAVDFENGVCKNSLGGDTHCHKRLLVLYLLNSCVYPQDQLMLEFSSGPFFIMLCF